MLPLTTTLLSTLAALLSAFLLLWLVSLKLRNASIVDPFWGAGFVLITWMAFALNGEASWRSWLLALLTTIWGLRLSFHLLVRNARHGEDRRYAAMRRHHGDRFWWVSLFTVFVLQAVIAWGVSFPIQAAMVGRSTAPFGWLDGLGLAAWSVGLFFEAVGDLQMRSFQADPRNRGQVLDRGLWRYTRHPNYFGDCCVWWGLYLVATAGGAVWTVFSPLLMTWLLLKVSGVTLLEQTITERRPAYSEYQQRTSAFFPWPPRGVRSKAK